jgi:hypothetical protein
MSRAWLCRIADGGVAEAALGRVDDALEGEIVGLARRRAQIGHGIADFEALVEARAADDAIRRPRCDEAVLESRASGRRRAPGSRSRSACGRCAAGCSISSPISAGFLFLTVPGAGDGDLLVVLDGR